MRLSMLLGGLAMALIVLMTGTSQAAYDSNDWHQKMWSRSEGPERSARSQKRPASPQRQASRRSQDEDSGSTRRRTRTARSSESYSGSGSPSGGGSSYQSGVASYYWQPQRVASGGMFNPNAMTAAHKTLPFGTKVRVTANNGRSVVVTINDRGPYVGGRVIDLSSAAAGQLGMKGAGVARVNLAVLGR